MIFTYFIIIHHLLVFLLHSVQPGEGGLDGQKAPHRPTTHSLTLPTPAQILPTQWKVKMLSSLLTLFGSWPWVFGKNRASSC